MAIANVVPIKSTTHLSSCLAYILNPEKTSGGELVYCSDCDSATAYTDFLEVQKMYDETDGRIAHQFIHSFPREQGVTNEQALELAKELAEKAFPAYQCVIATHTDSENTVHSHIVVNAINAKYGYRYHDNLETLSIVRKINDDICLEHGLPIIDHITGLKSIDSTTSYLTKTGKSWKYELKTHLDFLLASNQKMIFPQLQEYFRVRGFELDKERKTPCRTS